jgi:protein-arginine kinase activator protein McsA
MTRHTGAKLSRSAWGLTGDSDLDWRQRGSCHESSLHPDSWTGDNAEASRAAAWVCEVCPVKKDCYDWAVKAGAIGIYGGVLLRGPGKRRHNIRIHPLRSCDVCGTEFQATNNTQRFCGAVCYEAHRLRKRRRTAVPA